MRRRTKTAKPKQSAARRSQQRRVGHVIMRPVPVGARIAQWHYWHTDVLSMTEGERVIYYGRSQVGRRVTSDDYEKLFYVEIPNDHLRREAVEDRDRLQDFYDSQLAKLQERVDALQKR